MKNRKVKTKTVYQMEMTECGAASLGMILSYYGCYVPLEKLRVDTGVSRDGCNAYNIILGGEKYGLKGKGVRLSADLLRNKTFPCIIHWNFNHFVVCEGMKGKYVFINDPAQGRYKVEFSEFEKSFTGVALLFEKKESFKARKDENSVFDALIKRVGKQREGFLFLILAGFLLILPGLLIPMLSQVFVDQVLERGSRNLSGHIALLMLLALIFQVFLSCYRDYIQEKISRKSSILYTRDFTEHILKLPISFFEQRYIGDVIGRSDSNDRVNEFLLNDLTGVLLNAFTAAFYLFILIRRSLLMTVIGLAGIGLDFLISQLQMEKVRNLSEKNSIDQGRLSGIIFSGFSISETLKASGMENEYAGRIIGQEAKCANAEQENNRIQAIMNAFSGVAGSVTNTLMLLVGAFFVINGRFSAGMLVSFLALYEMLAAPVKKMISFVQTMQTMRAGLNRIEDVEKYPLAHTFNKDTKKLVRFSGKLSGEIEIRDLSFGYNSLYPPLVEDFGFHLSCGKTLALVGSSGSGKSTVGKLLSGMYPAWKGEIMFDGIPRDRIPENVLNASIATVSQNVVLFGGTIRQNLTMWNDNILEEDIIRAAKDACIHDIIVSRTGAYDNVLSENGRNLSGGQRQRLEIARALALNPSILIMDEATSALDPETEKKIIDNIKRRGCTSVIVAHRLSAIRDCDEILVMDHGRVVQRGTHEALMKEDGYYKELVRNM
jgi:NHLM bacteriocin system ABC transporter peptidase/ATP-binding protein